MTGFAQQPGTEQIDGQTEDRNAHGFGVMDKDVGIEYEGFYRSGFIGHGCLHCHQL